MLAKETVQYTIAHHSAEEYAEARRFADSIDAFYGWGGAKVRITENPNLLIVEYDHLIETKEATKEA